MKLPARLAAKNQSFRWLGSLGMLMMPICNNVHLTWSSIVNWGRQGRADDCEGKRRLLRLLPPPIAVSCLQWTRGIDTQLLRSSAWGQLQIDRQT